MPRGAVRAALDDASRRRRTTAGRFEDQAAARRVRRGDRTACRGERSIANSAGLIGVARKRASTGCVPASCFTACRRSPQRAPAELGLRPAMTLATRLIAVHACARAKRSATTVLARSARLAHRQWRRSATAMAIRAACRTGAPVLVNGREAPIVGRVSMDMIDDRCHRPAGRAVGDEVVLWGQRLPAERRRGQCGHDWLRTGLPVISGSEWSWKCGVRRKNRPAVASRSVQRRRQS